MELSYFWSYLYYLTEARNEYYVHSPFVYALMERCLRKNIRPFPEKRDRLFERVREFVIASGLGREVFRIPQNLPADKTFYSLAPEDRAAVFIDLPHRGRERETAWRKLCDDPDISLTIDLFRAGLVFPCLDRSKEHFCLRYF